MDEAASDAAPRDRARVEQASGERIQRLIDGLARELELPVSIDDEKFRLQFYSPQQGTLDRVRIESILFRDSPEEAKQWVRSHGVADARGPIRLPAADDLGLLGRVCTPLPHQDTLLGYLWIIDADARLEELGFERVRRCADIVAPLLYRRRFFDRLDRQAERDALIDLVDQRRELRQRGAVALSVADSAEAVSARVLLVRILPQTTAIPGNPPEDSGTTDVAGDDTAVELSLELALEQSRGIFPAGHFRFFRRGTEAVVLLTGPVAEQSERSDGASERLYAAVHRGLMASRVVIGVGRRVLGLEAALTSYLDARDAAEIAARDSGRPAILSAQWLGAHRALLGFPPAMLEQIAADALGPLQGHRDSEMLLTTLEAFLVHGGVIPVVAERLALHRSSVYGRLRRVEGLLGIDLDEGEIRLALHHAIVALRLARAETTQRQM